MRALQAALGFAAVSTYLLFLQMEMLPPVQKQEPRDNTIYLTESDRHLRDTLFTSADAFIEINLRTQRAVARYRGGSSYTFGVSTGTPRLFKGIDTTPGLYMVQAKSKRWYSSQFDSTLMLYWMPFNFGIGFHALSSSGYYKYLGEKPSSHGCVRISREDGQQLFETINTGTPVLVHSGDNAVTIGFTRPHENYNHFTYSEMRKMVDDRLNRLYSGRYKLEVKDKLLLSRSNVTHSGLPLGYAENIPERQVSIPPSPSHTTAEPDRFSHINSAETLLGRFLLQDTVYTAFSDTSFTLM